MIKREWHAVNQFKIYFINMNYMNSFFKLNNTSIIKFIPNYEMIIN